MQRKWYLISPKNPQATDSETKNYKGESDGNRSSASSLTLTEEELDNVILADKTYTSECQETFEDDKNLTTGDSNIASGTENNTNTNNDNDTVKNNLKLIEDVENNVLALQYEIVSFSGSQEDKKYLYLEDAMVKYLVLLDGIETNQNEDLRFKRKEAVFLIQQHIDLLDAKTNENIRKRSVVLSREQQQLASQGQNAQWSSYRGEPLQPRQRTTIQDTLPDNWMNYNVPHNNQRTNIHNQNAIFNHWDEGGNYTNVPMEIDEDDVDFEL